MGISRRFICNRQNWHFLHRNTLFFLSIEVEVFHIIFVTFVFFLLVSDESCFVSKQDTVVFVNKLTELNYAGRGVDSRLVVVRLPPQLSLNSKFILRLKVIL